VRLVPLDSSERRATDSRDLIGAVTDLPGASLLPLSGEFSWPHAESIAVETV